MEEDYLGPLERRIMERLWQAGPQTVANMVQALNASAGRKLAYTTVMTVLVRLLTKGYVSRRADGRGFRYRAAMDEAGLAALLGHRELRRLIDRFGAESLARFAEDLTEVEMPLARGLRALAANGDERRDRS
ncbi:MAG: BlaI/MecI/CopY family transcriptional regulator [Chloroflexi bacterium]|nr:BlaI/MecI/CopY family transcriptional regulator [Chloroflexota bacterium]